MNKFIVLVALVAALAGVASANSKKNKHFGNEESCCERLEFFRSKDNNYQDFDSGDFEGGFGFGSGGHGSDSGSDFEFGDNGSGSGSDSDNGFSHGGQGGSDFGHGGSGGGSGLSHGGNGGHGFGHGGNGIQHGGSEFGHGGSSFGHPSGGFGHPSGGFGGHGGQSKHRPNTGLRRKQFPKSRKPSKKLRKHNRQPKRVPLHLRRKQHQGGEHPHHLAGGAGIGAIGGIRGQESHSNNFQSGTHLGSSDVIEGHKGNFKLGNAGFEFDTHKGDRDELEGVHKHQVLNRDKTFIKDKTSGVSDVEGFRNTDAHDADTHLGAGIGGFSGSEAGGSIRKDREFDHDLSLSNSGESSGEAAGAKGAVF